MNLSKLEIYRFVSWYKQEQNNFVICFGSGKYDVIRNLGKYVISNYFISRDNPLEFIASQSRAFNAETTTGIMEIKRVYYKNLPKLVKQIIRESYKDA